VSKSRRMLAVSPEDVETAVLHDGLRLLSQVDVSGRRRVLAYWCARAETLPLTSIRGDVLDEHPIESDPPLIQFIHHHQVEEAGA
jgi:hypothetical protein